MQMSSCCRIPSSMSSASSINRSYLSSASLSFSEKLQGESAQHYHQAYIYRLWRASPQCVMLYTLDSPAECVGRVIVIIRVGESSFIERAALGGCPMGTRSTTVTVAVTVITAFICSNTVCTCKFTTMCTLALAITNMATDFFAVFFELRGQLLDDVFEWVVEPHLHLFFSVVGLGGSWFVSLLSDDLSYI